MAVNIGPKIGVDGEAEYRAQMRQIIQQTKTLESQMKLVASQFTATTSAEEKNTKTAAVLTEKIKAQRDMVKLLAEQTGKAAAKYGPLNEYTLKYQESLNKATASLNEMQNELREATEGASDFGDEMDESSDSVLSFGDVVKANVLADLVVEGFRKMADAAKQFAADMIDAAAEVKATNAQFEQTFGDLSNQAATQLSEIGDAAGILPTRLKSAYTQLYAYARSSGMESAAALKFATDATYAAADAAAYYDRSLEEATEQVLAYTKGNFANDAALGFASTEATRNAQAMASLGKEYKDLDVTAGEATQVLLDQIVASQKLSGAFGQASREMDGWENVTGNAKEAWKQFQAAVGAPFLEAITPIVQKLTAAFMEWQESVDWSEFAKGVSDFISGIIEHGDKILSLVAGIGAGFVTWNVASLISGVVSAIQAFRKANEGATIAQAALNAVAAANPFVLLATLAAGLVTAIITLWNTNEDFRNGVIAAWESIKAWVSGAIADIGAWFVQAGADITALWESVTTWIANAAADVVSWFKQAGEDIKTFFVNLGAAIAEKAKDIANAVKNGAQAAINWLKELPGRAITLGINIVKGIFNGIKNATQWLFNKLRGWVDDVVGFVLHLFGINSPSKVFADEVGKFIPPGITLGVEQAMPKAMRDMGAQLSALSAVPMPGGTTTNLGGVSIVVYGAQGQDVSELADIVMARMQNAVERREAVFA